MFQGPGPGRTEVSERGLDLGEWSSGCSWYLTIRKQKLGCGLIHWAKVRYKCCCFFLVLWLGKESCHFQAESHILWNQVEWCWAEAPVRILEPDPRVHWDHHLITLPSGQVWRLLGSCGWGRTASEATDRESVELKTFVFALYPPQ